MWCDDDENSPLGVLEEPADGESDAEEMDDETWVQVMSGRPGRRWELKKCAG